MKMTEFDQAGVLPVAESTTESRIRNDLADLFTESFSHLEHLRDLLHLSMRGIRILCNQPQMIEAMQKVERLQGKSTISSEQIARANAESQLAIAEVRNGFPLLHAQASISLWGTLESLVRSLLISILAKCAESRSLPELKKVRLSFGDLEDLTGEDRYNYVLDLLEDSLKTRQKPGIARFEELLQAFGLSGTIEPEIKKTLFELYHVRNVLVHRRGIADARFAKACPWMNVTPNERLQIEHNSFLRYHETAMKYITQIVQRSSAYLEMRRTLDASNQSAGKVIVEDARGVDEAPKPR
jgi:hypothetical protein